MKPWLILAAILSSSVFAEDVSSYHEVEINAFKDLTFNLFESEQLDYSFLDGVPISEVEEKALNGGQYLYCSIVADKLFKVDVAPKFYDVGMVLLDDYATKYAVRDKSAYETLKYSTYFSSKIPMFNQSFLINDKQILKGIIFEKIDRIINTEFYKDNPLANKNDEKFNKIYADRCRNL